MHTGSCLGALIRLLASHPAAFRDFLDQPPTSGPSQQQEVQHTTAAAAVIAASTLLQAGQIYDMLQAFLVTHAHWGEFSGQVFDALGWPCCGKPRALTARGKTLDSLGLDCRASLLICFREMCVTFVFSHL